MYGAWSTVAAMRRALPAVAAGTLIVGSTVLAFRTGGYLAEPRILAAGAAWVLVGLAAVFAHRPLPTSTAGRIALVALFGLTAWTALSISWAPVAGSAEADTQRLLLYLAAFVAGCAFLRESEVRAWLEPAICAGVLIVVLYGLSERLLPGLVELDRSRTSLGRLEQPVTYWNAFGILAVIGLLLAVRLAGDPGRPRALRGVAAAAGVPIGLGVYLTFARGALAALVVGLLVLVALAPEVRTQLRGIASVLVPTGATVLVANALPTIKSLPAGQEADAGDGLIMLAVLLVAMAAGPAMALRRPSRPLPPIRLPASRPVTVLTIAILAVLAGGLAVAALEGKPQGFSPEGGADPSRLASIDTNRYRYWDVALREFAEHPLAGLGSGGFAVEWLKERTRFDGARDAHSLYLETAAELGMVGVLLLALFFGGVAAAAVRLYRLDAAQVAGPAAAAAAWACHAGLDWDWEMPAATLPVLLLGAAIVAWSEDGHDLDDRAAVRLRGEPEGRPRRTPEGAHASRVG